MELRHLRYFVAVADALSFRGAASQLHLAQPSLSRQIRDLEEEIGEPLFDRNRRRVQLTDAGRVMLVEARGILASAEAALKTVREVGRGVRGVLRIGNTGHLTAPFLPATLATFREKFPLVEIEIFELGPDEQLAGLDAGTIQVGFQAHSKLVPIDPRFATHAMLRGEAIVAVPTRHPFAGRKSIALTDLADEKLLNFHPRQGGSGYERWLRAYCEQVGGFTPKLRRPPLSNWDAMIGMVAAGEGICLMPLAIAEVPQRWVGLVAKKLSGPRPDFEVAAIWLPDNRSVVVRNYLEKLAAWKR